MSVAAMPPAARLARSGVIANATAPRGSPPRGAARGRAGSLTSDHRRRVVRSISATALGRRASASSAPARWTSRRGRGRAAQTRWTTAIAPGAREESAASTAAADDGDDATASSSSSSSSADADAIVDRVLDAIADTDSGRDVTDAVREAVDADIVALAKIASDANGGDGARTLTDPRVYGDYDVSYVSTGRAQIGNPAGGRFRGGIGAMLFRTIGLEQNLYEPNVVVNRVAFLVFGLIPGEVVLDGTFEAMTEDLADPNAQPAAEDEEETTETRDGAGGTDTSPGEGESTPPNDAEGGGGGEKEKEKEKAYEREVVVKKGYGVDDGMTVRAFFAPPKIKFGGFPAFSVGPKSSVVLSTTYLDERIRLGRGSRGSLFVFTRKTREDAERDRKRWAVGGLGVTVFLAATLGFFVVAWRRFTAGGVTELSVATAVAVVVSFAMALVMRQGGIIAEDADYDEKYDTVVAKAAATARRRRAANEGE